MKRTLYKRIAILSVGIVIMFLSFLIPWDMFLPPWNAYHYADWKISPGVVGTARLDLLWGTSVRGKIECFGANDDIDFRITDSEDHVVFNPGRIFNGYEFRWQAWSNDIYYFKFDNTISVWTTKTVGYAWYIYLYFHLFLLIGTISTIIGFTLTLKEAFKLRT